MRRLTAALAAAATALTLAGCGGNDDPTTPTPSDPKTASPTSSPTPTTPEEQAKADALATVTRYYQVQDEIGQDPAVPLKKLRTVAISSDLKVLTQQYQEWRAKGWTKTGSVKVVTAQVEDVSMDNADPANGRAPSVVITGCVDASDVDVRDAKGNSQVVETSKPRTYTNRYVIANYEWTQNPRDAWRVVSVRSKKVGEPCES